MKRLFPTLVITVCALSIAVVTARAVLRRTYQHAAVEICDLIKDQYYKRDDQAVREFLLSCRSRLRWDESIALDKELIAERVNSQLRSLGVSHLALYSPVEDQQLWENEGLDTGLRARRIEDKIVITKVLAKSPAERAGVEAGDVVLAIEELEPSVPSDVQASAGRYRLESRGRVIERVIEPESLAENLGPRLRPLILTANGASRAEEGPRAERRAQGRGPGGHGGVGLLELPSFLPQYFREDEWRAIGIRLADFERLVIDLRGNAGGSFPGMLRALSPFRCDRKKIGLVYQAPRAGLAGETDLRDDLDAQGQLEQLSESAVVRLATFDGYGCYRGPVTILVDSDTASTAEIFAQAFFTRPRSRVWGQFTSGRVVMARWFQIGSLGLPSYTLSIPIAGYRAADGVEIEGVGVEPQRTLHYELKDALQGRDTWLEAALVD